MTQKEIEALHLGVTGEGTICLCKKDKKGNSRLVRNISPEESVQICQALYTLFKVVHPDDKVMYLPYQEDVVLAITEMKTEKTE